MTDYLTVAVVLAMHADQVERYGGSQGVRDRVLMAEIVEYSLAGMINIRHVFFG